MCVYVCVCMRTWAYICALYSTCSHDVVCARSLTCPPQGGPLMFSFWTSVRSLESRYRASLYTRR